MQLKVFLKYLFQIVTRILIPIILLLILIFQWKTFNYSDIILIIGLTIIFIIGINHCIILSSVI